MDNVKECLWEAMKLYVNKFGNPVIPAKEWPPFFKRVGQNAHWSNEPVCCVIREPDNNFYMIVVSYDPIADISVNYVTEDGIFRSLALVHKDNSPFSIRAASALREIQVTSSWQEVVNRIRTRTCSDAESIEAIFADSNQ